MDSSTDEPFPPELRLNGMQRILGALCFWPITALGWSLLLKGLAYPEDGGWVIGYLTFLTLGLVAFRLRSTRWCVAALVIQCGLGFFFMAFSRGGFSRTYGQLTSCKSNLKNTATALEMYARDHHGAYPLDLSQLVPNYLRILPSCPSARKDTYSVAYHVHGDAYTMFCSGENHARASTPAGYPRYTSREGLIER